MGSAYPADFRQRVVSAYESGRTIEQTAVVFGIGTASVRRWVKQLREVGDLEPGGPSPGAPPRVTREELEAVLSKLRDATSKEIGAALNRGRRGKARVHVSSVKRALHRYGYVVKKSE